MELICINTIFYAVKAVVGNFLYYCTSTNNCKVPEQVLMMIDHKENESRFIKSRYKDQKIRAI